MENTKGVKQIGLFFSLLCISVGAHVIKVIVQIKVPSVIVDKEENFRVYLKRTFSEHKNYKKKPSVINEKLL